MTLRGRQIRSSGLQLFISPLKSHLMLLEQSRRAPASVRLHPVFRLAIGPGDTFTARWPTSSGGGPRHVRSDPTGELCHFSPKSPPDVHLLCQTARSKTPPPSPPLLPQSQHCVKVQTCLRCISADDRHRDEPSIHICLGSLAVLAHGSSSA